MKSGHYVGKYAEMAPTHHRICIQMRKVDVAFPRFDKLSPFLAMKRAINDLVPYRISS
jgi:hypothetical protein